MEAASLPPGLSVFERLFFHRKVSLPEAEASLSWLGQHAVSVGSHIGSTKKNDTVGTVRQPQLCKERAL